MEEQEVISALCDLASEVGRKVYGSKVSHDCFCQESKGSDFHFDPVILEYIRNAVREKMNRA